MYRSEVSGVLGGLTGVRAIQLNDAHIFCTLDPVAEEAQAAPQLTVASIPRQGCVPKPPFETAGDRSMGESVP